MDALNMRDTVNTLLERARCEFEEQPTLRLTPTQAQRLLSASPQETAAVLERLLEEGYLRRSADGVLGRPVTPPRRDAADTRAMPRRLVRPHGGAGITASRFYAVPDHSASRTVRVTTR